MAVKKITLGVLIIAALCAMVYSALAIKAYIAASPPVVDLYYKKAAKFKEEQKTEVIRSIAGLWTFRSDTVISGRKTGKTDRLEIKDNGIAWQVVDWDVVMPSDSIRTFRCVRTAFVKPYGTFGNDTLNDAAILAQAFISGSDTAFGYSLFGEMWATHRSGKSLVLGKRMYKPYTGAIAEFFPPDMVSLVQDAESQFFSTRGGTTLINKDIYTVKRVNKATGAVTFLPILDSLTGLADFFTIHLYAEYDRLRFRSSGSGEIGEFIARYYQPFLIEEKWRMMPQTAAQTVAVSFTISKDGATEDIRLPRPQAVGRTVYAALKREIAAWRFPPGDSAVHITHMIALP
ncbi:MAG: hypothetical protein MUF22_05345 [Chitinispirillaceae bacterium]|nr:hypothetical protein [Chitinispirillaceae bacterium]